MSNNDTNYQEKSFSSKAKNITLKVTAATEPQYSRSEAMVGLLRYIFIRVADTIPVGREVRTHDIKSDLSLTHPPCIFTSFKSD